MSGMQQESRSHWSLCFPLYFKTLSLHPRTFRWAAQGRGLFCRLTLHAAWGWCFPAAQYTLHCRTWQNKPDNNLLRERPFSNTSWRIMIKGKRRSSHVFFLVHLHFISCLLECYFASSHMLQFAVQLWGHLVLYALIHTVSADLNPYNPCKQTSHNRAL